MRLAHSKGRQHRVGILAQDLQPGLLETFRDELHKLGYVEGKTISIELRNAAGRNERLPELVEELLQLKVEVIVAVNTPAAQAAKKATKTVPVVMMRVADPVKSGLVASLARPGGNVTGLSFMPDALGPKGVELLHEILPKATRMAALYQGNNTGAVIIVDEVERKASKLGLKFVRLPVHDEATMQTLSRSRPVLNRKHYSSWMTARLRSTANKSLNLRQSTLSRSYRSTETSQMPADYIAYGPKLNVVYRRAADYVDKLIKGEPAVLFRLNSP